MRRFVCLVVLLLFTIPFGISVTGCAKKSSVQYCSGNSGPVIGQATAITLSPRVYGVSINYGAIGATPHPAATDCQGNSVTIQNYTYGSSDTTHTIVDVNPATGALCAGTWNRNSGGGVADYTYCNATNKSGTAYIVASGEGQSSNPLPVYVHPTVTSIVLGPPSQDCLTDPATNCSPAAYSTSQTSCTVDPNTGCCTTPLATTTNYVANSCLSQNTTGQLAARVYDGPPSLQNNISCRVGHLTYSAQSDKIVTFDQNGVATAVNPGSTVITASVANAGSTAGFFSTCPPYSIDLSVPLTGAKTVTVNPNNPQPLNAVVKDKNGVVLTGLDLEFVSTTPTTIPGGSTITPLFPGSAGITAICQPPSCNPSPFNQIGLFGNGTPIVSNNLTVNAPGKNSTVLYIASTNSQYIVPVDFSQPNATIAPVRLPFVPNSMVIDNAGATIYLGSDNGLMTFNASSNGFTSLDPTTPGNVLAVSPDDATIVVSDPNRKLVYLTSSKGITSQYGGVGTHAEFSPDSQTVYITTTTNKLLVYSTLTGWSSITIPAAATDVAVTVPSVGAFLSGPTTTARGQCPITTTTTSNGLPSSTNEFYPDAGVSAPKSDMLAATNDGQHILGATASPAALTDLFLPDGVPTGACPSTGALHFNATPNAPSTLAGVTATAITGVDPASDSSIAFVTYTGTGGVLPAYTPQTGSMSNIALTGSAIAPVAGVFSADNSTFFVGTSGDNNVHLITRSISGTPSTWTDDPAKTIKPNLTPATGTSAVPNLLVQKPRKSTS
ncbi:MAG TPA: hypothetical protein VFE38_12300 [Edaphobacter sp.]|nr:hypothetical protein [Edaphobacter sp.]